MPLFSLPHLRRATLFSLAGLRHAWRSEQSFRHEVLLLPAVVLLLLVVAPGPAWSGAALLAWLLVMALELLNSAIEIAFNLISPDYNEQVKFGKDMASAALFLALVGNAALWLCLLWDVYGG
jgi:diacylglycerol kinase (ATP)